MILLLIFTLATFLLSGYDLIEFRKMKFANAKKDGDLEKQNHCQEVDYDYFDYKNRK